MSSTRNNGARQTFYGQDGTGRDSYIYMNNGGLNPARGACKIEELGTFAIQRQQYTGGIPRIHSKGVQYINNGGGRDTYVSFSSGGLNNQYQPAHFKRTFYNNLRVYNRTESSWKPTRSSTAGTRRGDMIMNQSFCNDKFHDQLNMISAYQRSMDKRLSQPKRMKNVNKELLSVRGGTMFDLGNRTFTSFTK